MVEFKEDEFGQLYIEEVVGGNDDCTGLAWER